LKIPLKYTSLGICRNPDPKIKISQPWSLADYCPGIRQKLKTWKTYIPGPEIEIPKTWFILHSGAGNLKSH